MRLVCACCGGGTAALCLPCLVPAITLMRRITLTLVTPRTVSMMAVVKDIEPWCIGWWPIENQSVERLHLQNSANSRFVAEGRGVLQSCIYIKHLALRTSHSRNTCDVLPCLVFRALTSFRSFWKSNVSKTQRCPHTCEHLNISPPGHDEDELRCSTADTHLQTAMSLNRRPRIHPRVPTVTQLPEPRGRTSGASAAAHRWI